MNPLFAWQMLGFRVAETLLASSHVISHRTQRQNTPAQLFEMGNEKVQAAMESSHALTRHWMSMAGRDPLDVWAAWPKMLASGLAPFHTRAKKNARRVRT
jgi:hypothetical protein